MMFSILQHRAKTLITENASTILTAGGVIGTVTTATLAGRAAFKAADIIREEEVKAVQEGNGHTMGLSNWERTRLVWPLFIPPVIIGGATIGSIVMANQMSAQRAAALAAAYGISQKQLDEYKRKLEEKLGVKKAEAQGRAGRQRRDRHGQRVQARRVLQRAGAAEHDVRRHARLERQQPVPDRHLGHADERRGLPVRRVRQPAVPQLRRRLLKDTQRSGL
jgi:hypothetical protein